MKIERALEFGMSRMMLEKLQARGIPQFTAAQSEALKAGLCKGTSLLVCAPTSSGKTTIAEIAAVEGARNGHRTVYLVSHRALAEEKYRLFLQSYSEPGKKWFDVSIATGDRTEGDWHSGILVSTYEKYLALLCSSVSFDMKEQVVVADEIQILGPLECQVWYEGNSIYCHAGETDVFEGRERRALPSNTLEAVDYLLQKNRGPILVFTLTRPQARKLAEAYASKRQHAARGLQYAEQFDLFSEPSTLVRSLMQVSQRGVVFHTADLTHSERTLIESGLRDSLFEVVFATPTLAAGVNFPFQTVLFDGFYRSFVPGHPWLPRSDFQNMAGRAGRLGMHEKGYAVLLANSAVEFEKARELISSPIEPLQSAFPSCSLRKIVLAMIASKVVRRPDDLLKFFEDTLWWQQTLDRNPKVLEEFPRLLEGATEYLEQNKLIVRGKGRIFATRIGVATAGTGLLPQTVIQLLDLFRKNITEFDKAQSTWQPAAIHAICASEEFGENGQRLLPYAWKNQPQDSAWHWISARTLFSNPEHADNADRVINATFGLAKWIEGVPERVLSNLIPPISYGYMQGLGNEAGWVLDGLSHVMRVPEAGFPSQVPKYLSDLSGSLRYGLPLVMLDTLRAAEACGVPGFGRHRAMALFDAKLTSPNDILNADRKLLVSILESEERADRLIEALLGYFDAPLVTLKVRHIERAHTVNTDADLVDQAYTLTGEAYEGPIENLLRLVQEWRVTKLDTVKRQGFPDLLIEFDGRAAVVECKTKQRGTATISKDEAFAVLTKGTNIQKDHSITIGKPDFDEFSKGKANGSKEITLIRHQDFIEAILRYKAGKLSARLLFQWLMNPGYAKLDALDAMALRGGDE